MQPSTASKWFLNFLRDYNMQVKENPEIPDQEKEKNLLPEYNFHVLRHTNATILYSLGVALREISHELGHKKLSTTSDVYVEFLKGSNKQLADKLENALGDKV
jgi:site-specific recombinase XerD